jgi:hypothetical protein
MVQMAIKFSFLGSFVTDIKRIASNPEQHYLKEDEVGKLKEILEELNNLHHIEIYHPDTKFIGPNIELNITEEVVDISSNPQRSGELFHQIHEVLQSHFVRKDIYVTLGKAFKELGTQNIDPDLQIAISKAYETRPDSPLKQWAEWPPDYGREFCPKAIIRKSKEGKGGRKEADF